jgi:ubiquinone/menaquinone biosynthesis C-methylase UbiE
MGRWNRGAGEAFLDWLSLPNGLRWLDVGCGTGAFTELVLDRNAFVWQPWIRIALL